MSPENAMLRLVSKYAERIRKLCPSNELPEASQKGGSAKTSRQRRYERSEPFGIQFFNEIGAISALCSVDPRARPHLEKAISKLFDFSHVELIYLNEALKSRLADIGRIVAERDATSDEFQA